MVLKFEEYIQLNENESKASLSDMLGVLLPNGWEYAHSNGGDGIKFIKKGYTPVTGHLKHGNSKDNNRKIDLATIKSIREILISEFLKDGDPKVINLIPWERWCPDVKDPFTRELIDYDKKTGKKKSDIEILSKVNLVQQIFKNVWVIQNDNGEYNLCRSEEDQMPLLDRWYPLFNHANDLGGKMCLGYDVEDFDSEEEFGTHKFEIKPDGTLGTTLGVDYVVESVKKS